MLGITKPTLYAEIAAGRLRSFKIGRRRMFRQAELERYVEALENAK